MRATAHGTLQFRHELENESAGKLFIAESHFPEDGDVLCVIPSGSTFEGEITLAVGVDDGGRLAVVDGDGAEIAGIELTAPTPELTHAHCAVVIEGGDAGKALRVVNRDSRGHITMRGHVR